MHSLKVTLRSVKPPVWRRIEVESDVALDELSHIIELAMGWLGWEHDIEVEAISPADPGATYPRCVAGRRACPPEDCGGPWGYQNLLDAIADKGHPRHRELTEWLPPDWDPAHFVPHETSLHMQEPQPAEDDWW